MGILSEIANDLANEADAIKRAIHLVSAQDADLAGDLRRALDRRLGVLEILRSDGVKVPRPQARRRRKPEAEP